MSAKAKEKAKAAPAGAAPRRVMWAPSHRAWCPLTPEERAIEVRIYDPADPPADFPGTPGLHEEP